MTLVAALACALLAGCTGAQQSRPDAMGMGMGAGSMVSLVEPGSFALLGEVATDSMGRLVMPSVVSPVDGWLVAHSMSAEGSVLGYAPVKRGRNESVRVAMNGLDSAMIILALHDDSGVRDQFEYRRDLPSRTPDKPIGTKKQRAERTVTLSGFGAMLGSATPGDEPSMTVDSMGMPIPTGATVTLSLNVRPEQDVSKGVLVVDNAVIPAPTWLVVQVVENGLAGTVVGRALVDGEFALYERIPLSDVPSDATELLVTLVADQGAAGEFEYDPAKALLSKDQPYLVNGATYHRRVRIER